MVTIYKTKSNRRYLKFKGKRVYIDAKVTKAEVLKLYKHLLKLYKHLKKMDKKMDKKRKPKRQPAARIINRATAKIIQMQAPQAPQAPLGKHHDSEFLDSVSKVEAVRRLPQLFARTPTPAPAPAPAVAQARPPVKIGRASCRGRV